MTTLTNAELLAKCNQLQEKLYDNNIDKRPTLMTEIEDTEKNYRNKIKHIQLLHDQKINKIKEKFRKDRDVLEKACEKETGRRIRQTENYICYFPPKNYLNYFPSENFFNTITKS